jgi:hypothetical protein
MQLLAIERNLRKCKAPINIGKKDQEELEEREIFDERQF